MQASSRSTTGLGRIAVILACAVSGGAHVGLVPAHLEHDPELGAAFILAALATLAAAVGLTLHAGAASVRAAAGVLAALLGA